jgi:AcrR family transcriptional regulator
LLDAVLGRGITEADRVIEAAGLDAVPADEALLRLVASGWQVLDRYLAVRAVASRLVDPEHLRARHDPLLSRVRQLISRGRAEGVIRTDVPAGWLLTAFYSLVHAAADDAFAGRLSKQDVPEVLQATLRSVLAPLPAQE